MSRRAARIHTARMQIYLVEDSAIVRQRLEAMMNRIAGVSVVGHASGANDAIGEILAKKPDVVVVDLKLAQGTGFDVLRALRVRAPEVACYMLSNFATEPYRRLAAELGARDFFDKTAEFENVRDVIAQRAAESK
jgi:DNA-binding NarL/FixJ family response regulator